MSVEATSWALQQQAITDPAARAVLFGLANHANHEGRHAFPSVDLLCRYTGLGRRTVIAKLKRLQDEGLIRKGNQKVAAAIIDRADRRPVVYDLALGVGIESIDIGDEQSPDVPESRDAENAPRENEPGAADAPREGDGVQMTTPRGARAAPETSLTNPYSHSGAGKSIFEQAARRTDDGGTVPTGGARQFPMTLDWQPDPEQLAAACQRAGLPADTQPKAHQLAKFTAHHADQGRRYGAMAWTAKLVDWIRNDQRQQAQQQTQPTGGSHANRQQRTPRRRLTAAEARERDRALARGEQPGDVLDGDCTPG
ncbi:helix-turn-helix domain-containing protein [Chromohalobacter moromii]|uniref:Helix-turn-helix domain-containing protein n=1 Tax=Chromohalobacter moromii TaxID=2860329 RepID=A0A9X2X3S0_9GAMM|nr:helix-turn-helix domain-containing protein [Chromohalobacter moromii]MCT8506165.1 helix-turn-helix domain-containing protein [Chromohalobacter moromii]